MPKIVRSAAQALGAEKPVEETPAKSSFAGGSLLQRDTIPETAEVKIADPAPTEPTAPQAGFETPPAATDSTPSVEPKADSTSAVGAKDQPAPTPVKEWRFVKNVHTHEKIVLEDGTEMHFKHSLFVMHDPALAEKIIAVAKRYNIVEQ